MSKWTGVVCLSIVLLPAAGCIRYRARPIEPRDAEREFRSRSLDNPELRAFAAKQAGAKSPWPPSALDLESFSLTALYYSPELNLARARIRSADAAVVTARGGINPAIAAGAGHEGGPDAPLIFRFDPTLTLVTAGKRGYRILQAEKLAEVSRLELAEISWKLRSRLRTQLIELLFSLNLKSNLDEQQRLGEERVGILEKRLAAGEASRPELVSARAELDLTRSQVRAAEGSAASNLASLASILGVPAVALAGRRFNWPGPEDLPQEYGLTLRALLRAGVQHRLDVRRALMEYAVAEASLQLEVARQYPDIEFSPGYSYDEGHNKIMLSSGFSIPWPNRNRGPIGEAASRRKEAEARFTAVQSRAIGEMEVAEASHSATLGELAEANKAAILQEEKERYVRRAFELGDVDRLALGEALIAGLAAHRARLEAFRKAQVASGSLEDAVQKPLAPDLSGTQIPTAFPPPDISGKEPGL